MKGYVFALTAVLLLTGGTFLFLRHLEFAPLPAFPRRDWSAWQGSSDPDPRLHALILRHRIACRAELTRRLLAAELSFPETAAHFRNVDRREVRVPPRQSGLPPARTEEESYCLQVIAWTAAELSGQADRDLVVAELEAELYELLRAHGRPRLPAVDTEALLQRLGLDRMPEQ